MTKITIIGLRDRPIEECLLVSGLIQSVLAHLRIRTIGDLLALNFREVLMLKGVGERKTELLLDLVAQALNLCQDEGANGANNLNGDGAGWPSAGKRPTHFLAGLPNDILETDWRDVPLNLPRRVVGFLDRFGFHSLGQLDRLAISGMDMRLPSGNPLRAEKHSQFGETSLLRLRTELKRLSRRGLKSYRSRFVCDIDDIDVPDMNWNEVPLRISARVRKVLKEYHLDSIRQVHRLAVRAQVFSESAGQDISVLNLWGFNHLSLADVRRELNRLANAGLEAYRYGGVHVPQSARNLVNGMLASLGKREGRIVSFRMRGYSLQEIKNEFGVSRERVRQIEHAALTKLVGFRPAAIKWIAPVKQALIEAGFLGGVEVARLLNVDEPWHATFIARVSGNRCEPGADGCFSWFSGPDDT
jgi:DNA-binding CsgD family transcriptional regulator